MANEASIEAPGNANADLQRSLAEDLDAAKSFAEETRVSLTEQLRLQFPFLATATLEKLVEEMTKTLRNRLEQAGPAMAVSKARTNFFSLPPELRNCILEYAMQDSPLGLATSDDGACVEVSGEAKSTYWCSTLSVWASHRCKHTQECLAAACPTTCGPKSHQRVLKPSSLLHISRKLRTEVAPMFYGGKSFAFNFSDLKREIWIGDWLKLVGKGQASHIDKIDLVVQYPNIDHYLRDLNVVKHFKKAGWRGKKYKEIWGKQGLLGCLGLLGLGVPIEKFEFKDRNRCASPVVTPWEQNTKPDYSSDYYAIR